MNFSKKSKDLKRSSYYVWFLGTKESKGLRGDQYVTPVLHYLLDAESANRLEHPSKVTLQLSPKGMKIIQILSVPRKSSSSSLLAALKSEQVKHYIPHDSITWVYQWEDIICAILLLYNPRTRCPVHVHAYRCDSPETADSLRRQLQTLVSRPENQKKFHDIECRLYAKGLLLLPSPSPPSKGNRSYEEEDNLPAQPVASHQLNRRVISEKEDSPSSYKVCASSSKSALNSDGRSTRTEGSDENCSEEHFSNDLRYGQGIHSQKMISRANKGNVPPRSSSSEEAANRKSFNHISSKAKNANKVGKSVVACEKELLPSELLRPVALYDSLAAELRAKLGNPKMGPILLPPRDYESGSKEMNSAKKTSASQYPLSRSESSGQSSSGIGSDEALSNDTQRQQRQSSSSTAFLREHHRHHQRDIDIDQHKRSTSFIFGDDHLSEDRSPQQLYHSLEMNGNFLSDFDENEDDDTYSCESADEVDTEDIEEDVLFTANFSSRSKSAYDLSVAHANGKQSAVVYDYPKYYRDYHQQQQEGLAPFYAAAPDVDPYREHKSHHQRQQPHQHRQHMTPLSSASNPNLTAVSSRQRQAKEVNQTRTVSDKCAYVVGRRRERSEHQQQQQHLHLLSPPLPSSALAGGRNGEREEMAQQQFFYSADGSEAFGEVGKSRVKTKVVHHEKAVRQPQQAFVNWHSMH